MIGREFQITKADFLRTVQVHFQKGTFGVSDVLSKLRDDGKVNGNYTRENVGTHLRSLVQDRDLERLKKGVYRYVGVSTKVREEEWKQGEDWKQGELDLDGDELLISLDRMRGEIEVLEESMSARAREISDWEDEVAVLKDCQKEDQEKLNDLRSRFEGGVEVYKQEQEARRRKKEFLESL